MNPIAALLARYKDLRPPSEALVNGVCEAVETIVKIKIKPSQVTLRRKTALVAGPSSLKSEIALKKQEIIEYIKSHGGDLTDIY
ncbi:MAG TPA: hypothetical protein VJG29_01870 [Candidatus Paceibacterota bacterium]